MKQIGAIVQRLCVILLVLSTLLAAGCSSLPAETPTVSDTAYTTVQADDNAVAVTTATITPNTSAHAVTTTDAPTTTTASTTKATTSTTTITTMTTTTAKPTATTTITTTQQTTTSTQTVTFAVYRTPTGKRYHFDPDCAGPNRISTTVEEAEGFGLSACKKCAGG